MNTTTRPFPIWFALAYIAVGLVTNIFILYQASSSLTQDGLVTFIVSLGMCALLALTFDAIYRRSNGGRRLAILSFTLIGVFAMFNAIALLQWSLAEPAQGGLLVGKIIVFGRIVASFSLAIVFGLSTAVHEYFGTSNEPGSYKPPPPPTF